MGPNERFPKHIPEEGLKAPAGNLVLLEDARGICHGPFGRESEHRSGDARTSLNCQVMMLRRFVLTRSIARILPLRRGDSRVTQGAISQKYHLRSCPAS